MPDNKKIKHKLYTRHSGGEAPKSVYRNLIKQAILMTLRSEDVDILCIVNVLITNDKGIREYNRDYRGIDKATDVLSFPMQTNIKAGWRGHGALEIDEDTGDLPLGDIILSTESVKRQAKEYGNTIERETTHLIIHSTLHLLGYDHANTENEVTMRSKEKHIISEMGYEDDQ